MKGEEREIGGKKHRVPVVNKDLVKKAKAQFKTARADAGYHYEYMKKYYDHGRNPVRNEFEKAAVECLEAGEGGGQLAGAGTSGWSVC